MLAAVCDPVLEVGDGGAVCRSVREAPAGSGPLAALAAAGVALRDRGHDGPALLLAVDLPAVDEAWLRWLRDRPGEPTVVPRVDGRLQPVCARYGADALVAAGSLVAGGLRALHDLFDVVEHDVIDEPSGRGGRRRRRDVRSTSTRPTDAAARLGHRRLAGELA